MNQVFDDARDKIFARYRKQVKEIFDEKSRYWWKPENGTELYFEYLRRFSNVPISDEVMYFLRGRSDIPSSDTITKRLREIKEIIREEEKDKFKELSDEDGLPNEEFAKLILS